MASKGLSSILVPTDFSPGAQRAFERALRLPLAPKAKITLLHVLPADIPGALRKEAIADSERSLEKHLAQARSIAVERGLSPAQFVGDVVEGNAAQQVMKRANTVEADVICIGRHGRRGVMDLIVGSTATRVMRQTEHPVLLVQSPVTGSYQHPLFAIDPTHKALSVVKQGLTLLEADTKRVNVFHATPIPYEDFISMTSDERTVLRSKFVKDGEKALKTLLKKISGVEFHPIVRSGDARTLVLEEAQSLGADLTVLGTHGKTALKSFIVGSVAEWVLSHATNDVLIVRP
ncbi:MAG: universal stress protein [Archangiaceae bacterium]|nr:universal stress protein [Archangiaceae bacterium]